MSKKVREVLSMPPADGVLLHACCAPCSGAIVEWMVGRGVRPVVFYYNPNIYPRQEYETRRDESRRHAEALGLEWVEGEWDHDGWLAAVAGHEGEAERGSRCLLCFRYRLLRSFAEAGRRGLGCATTTLASSRWKSLEQISLAGTFAEGETGVVFWGQNWRKGGLSERRAALLREYAFYNQRYCGCEFSMRREEE